MQPEQAPDTPPDRQSQTIFKDLIQEFEKIETVADLIEKQYELENSLKKSDLSREAYIKLFELYQKKHKEKQWLGRWYLAPFARFENLVEKTASTLNEMDIFKIIQQIGNIAIVFTVASLIWNVLPNRDKEIEEAWKVVESKDVGRRTRYAALEKLNRYNQPLDYLNLPTDAYLPKIKLAKANLSDSVLPKAILSEANLQGAVLLGAELQEAVLLGAELQGAMLAKANLQGARLVRANLQGALLWEANLQGAELWEAKLQEARLWGANLQGAGLVGAELQGAELWGANLQEATLGKAKFQGATYTDKNTKPEVCWKYFLSKHPCPTIFPKNFDPKAAGMVLMK